MKKVIGVLILVITMISCDTLLISDNDTIVVKGKHLSLPDELKYTYELKIYYHGYRGYKPMILKSNNNYELGDTIILVKDYGR